MKRIIQIILFFTICTAFSVKSTSHLHIYMIGDSTMADKPDTAKENPERGWGQLFHTVFDDRVNIHNHAVNGRSTKSFIEEGRWQIVLDSLQPGDYVFIQFGHNDQKVNDPKRYTNPWTGYRHNLEKFIIESQAKGAYPIILSSIVRRKFNEAGTLINTHKEYPFVAREVATRWQVPFIDMQWMTEEYVAKLGPEKSKEIYLWVEAGEYPKFPEGKQDDTHLNEKGARVYSALVAEAIQSQQIYPLSSYIK